MAAFPGQGCCFGGWSRDAPSGVARFGGAAIALDFGWFLSAYLLGDRLRRLSWLGASRPLWPDGRLLLATQFVPAGAPWRLFLALGWSGRRKRFMGWRGTMLRTGDGLGRLERPECGGWPQLGLWGLLALRDCPTVAQRWVAFGGGRSVQSSAPADHGGSAGRAQLRCPDKPARWTGPAEWP